MRPLLAVMLGLAVASCAQRSAPLPGETVTLRVAYVVNPGFPRMSADQIAALLATARRGAKENFGIDVEFTDPEEQALAPLFARATAGQRGDWNDLSYDFKNGKGD